MKKEHVIVSFHGESVYFFNGDVKLLHFEFKLQYLLEAGYLSIHTFTYIHISTTMFMLPHSSGMHRLPVPILICKEIVINLEDQTSMKSLYLFWSIKVLWEHVQIFIKVKQDPCCMTQCLTWWYIMMPRRTSMKYGNSSCWENEPVENCWLWLSVHETVHQIISQTVLVPQF